MDFKPGDVITAQVTKSDVKQPAGLKLEERHGRIYVRKIDALMKQRKLPVQAGDQLLKIFGNDVESYGKTGVVRLAAIKALVKTEKVITVVVLRNDPTIADDNSTDSETGGDDDDNGYPTLIHQDDLAGREFDDDDDDEDEEEEEDYFDPNMPLLTNGGDDIRPGSTMKLTGLPRQKKRLNGEQVKVLPGVSSDGEWDVQLGDGSRLSVKSDRLSALAEDEEVSVCFSENDPSVIMMMNGSGDDANSIAASSTRSFLPNLIEAGDMMKIRGLKKKAKMNGTHVEVLGPAEQPGRWEVLIADDPEERVISIAASNLRHIM